MTIFFVSGVVSVTYKGIKNYCETDDYEACVIAANVREAKRRVRESAQGYGFKSSWRKVEVHNVPVAFFNTFDLVTVTAGDRKFISDNFIMYDRELVPDCFVIGDNRDWPKFADYQIIRPLKPSKKKVQDGQEFVWYGYLDEETRNLIYIQEIYHHVIQMNGWILHLTSEQPDQPIFMLDKDNKVMGVVMPRLLESILKEDRKLP